MKKLFLIIISTIMISGFHACKKSSEKKPVTENYTQYPPPNWVLDKTGKYPASMTAVVSLAEKLNANQGEGDKLGAFIGGEYRGEGVFVQMDSSKVFFVLINGTASEQSKIRFRYYCKKTMYLYESASDLNFQMDDNYGTADQPKILDLTPLK
ncbi:MAG: hypothetical protein ABI151_17675 [Chitinophagaceae bacterium]